MHMYEITQTSTYGIQDPISYRVGDQIPPEDIDARSGIVFANQVGGSAKILSRLVHWRNRDGQGSHSCSHDYPAEIQCQYGSGNNKEEHKQVLEREIFALPEQGLLGRGRNLVKGILRVNSWDKRRDYKALCSDARGRRRWTSAAWTLGLIKYHACEGVGIYKVFSFWPHQRNRKDWQWFWTILCSNKWNSVRCKILFIF